jgi:hypothetical protein
MASFFMRHFAVLEQALQVLRPDMQVTGGFLQFKKSMWHNQFLTMI